MDHAELVESIRGWMQDRRKRTVNSTMTEAKRLAELANVHFEIQPKSQPPRWLRDIADEVVGDCKLVPRIYHRMEPFAFTRQDLEDIAFWANIELDRAAIGQLVAMFIREVVRGNIEELHKERCPEPEVPKLRIKRRSQT